MNSSSCSKVVLRKTGAVSRMKSFQNCPGSSSRSGAGARRIRRSSNPFSSSVPANDSSTTNTTRWPRRRSTSPMPTQLLVGPKAPSGKKTIVLARGSLVIAPGARGRSSLVRSGRVLELVALGPFQQRLDREHRVVDAGVKVAELGEPRRHGGDGQLLGVDVVELVPGDRGRHGAAADAADRVGAGDCVIAGILVVVDERLIGLAILAPPGGGGVARGTALNLSGEGEGGPADFGKSPSRLDPDVDVDA